MAQNWGLSPEQTANLGMGNNPFLGVDNPYLQQTIDKAQGDVVRNYNLSTQPAFNKAMVNSGSFGNEGVAQMNSEGQRQLQQTLADQSNAFRQQDYTNQNNTYQWQQGLLNQQDQFSRNLNENSRQYDTTFGEGQRQFNLGFGRNTYNDAYSQNMNNLTTGMGMLGNMYGYTGSDITNAGNMQNTPMNYWGQFNQAANGLGQGYGTNTSTTGSTSNPLMGAIGGAQLGNSAYNWWNQNYGGNTPQQTPSQINAFENMGGSSNWFGTGTGTT